MIETVKVKIQRVNDLAKMPLQATQLSSGFDVYATEQFVIASGERVLVPTGLRMAVPKGYECQVRPRSGLALKNGLTVLNSPGTIDADYRGDVGVIIINHSTEPYTVGVGTRIAQLVIVPVPQVELVEVDSLDETERGTGGFGSTGTK